MVGAAGAQALVILSTPVLTRLYDAADFGAFTAFTAVVGILSVVATLRLEAAIGLPTDTSTAVAVAWSGLVSSMVVGVLVAALGEAASEPVAGLFGVGHLAGLWWLVGTAVGLMGVYQVMSAWAVRVERYAALGVRDFSAGVGQACGQVGLGLAGLRPAGLLIGFGIARLAGMGGLMSGGLLKQPRPTPRQMARAVVRYRRFPLIASWSGVLNTTGTYAPLLVIGAYAGPTEFGLVGLAFRMIAAPSVLVGAAAARVFYGEGTAAIRGGHPVLRQAVWASVRRLFLLGLAPSVALLMLGPVLFGFVFGSDWQQAGAYAAVLSVGNLARFAVGGVTQTLLVLELATRQLRWDAGRLLLTAGLPATCLVAGGSVMTAVAALTVAYVAAYASLLAESVRAAGRFDATAAGGPGRAGQDLQLTEAETTAMEVRP